MEHYHHLNFFKIADRRGIIIIKKIIYLDWNIIKYIKKPRTRQQDKDIDLQLSEKIRQIKEDSAVCIPYSESHFNDILTSDKDGNEEFITSDIDFLNTLTNCKKISEYDGMPIIETEDAFKEYSLRKNSKIKEDELYNQVKIETSGIRMIDMSSIETDHLMYQVLNEHNGIIDNNSFCKFAEFIRDNIFSDKDIYKKFRESIKTIKSKLNEHSSEREIKELGLGNTIKFIDSLECEDENILCTEWKDIVSSFLMLDKRKIPEREVILNAYGLLDIHPLFNEKLKGKNKADNIVRDAGHITFARLADIYVSGDLSAIKKSKFLCKAYNLKPNVCSIEDFLDIELD